MVTHYIERLIDLAIDTELITARDRIYARNQILGLLDLQTFTAPADTLTEGTIPDCLKALLDDAVTRGVISDALDEREQLDAKIMDTFLSKPTEINATFKQLYDEDPTKATDYFYALSQNSHYIQTERIAKNIQYERQTSFGKVDITINLSKPEKDPNQIKREREMKQDVKYPQCLLCIENEGYPGRTGHPARSNHRVIDVDLGGEQCTSSIHRTCITMSTVSSFVKSIVRWSLVNPHSPDYSALSNNSRTTLLGQMRIYRLLGEVF